MYRPILAVTFSLALMSAAHADPRRLTETDLSTVTGGFLDTYIVVPTVVINNATTSGAVAIGSSNVQSTAISNIDVQNVVTIAPGDQVVTLQPGALPGAPVIAPSGIAPSFNSGQPSPTQSAPVWVPWARELRGIFGPGIGR